MRIRLLILLVVVAFTGFLPQSKAAIDLGSAGNFAVLGASTVTSTGDTVLTGDLGVWPGTAITGFYPPGKVNGVIYAGGPVAEQAQADALTAYNTAKGESVTTTLTGQDLGSVSTLAHPLTAGVYFFSSSAELTGTLYLSGPGTFVFQIGSTLTTATSSSVVLEGGAQAGKVFWQVGSSATLGTGTSFAGTILADASITLNTGASLLDGRALALNAAVTLDDNNIIAPVPEPASFWSGAFAASFVGIWQCLALWRRKAGRS